MKAEDLIPGKWYFGKTNFSDYNYFQFIKHGYKWNQPDNDYNTYRSIFLEI